MIIKCPECGHQVSDRAKTCPSCGIDIAGHVTRCPDCGEYIFKDDHECPNCHCTINASASVPAAEQDAVTQAYGLVPEIPEIPQPEKPKKKTGYKILWSSIVVGFVIALIIVFLGIYFYQKSQQENEIRAYENAMMSAEPAVLQNFLDMYIDASVAHRDSIKAHLEILKKVDRDWQNALAKQSKAALQLFMERNPENVHVPEARLIIDSLDFEAAKLVDTMDAYQKYMDSHQQGAYYDEAARAYDSIREKAEEKRRQAQQDSIMKAQKAAENNAVQPKPAQPAAKPAQPKPAQTTTKPAQTTTKPAQTTTKPAQPATKPAQPASKPAQPKSTQSTQPAKKQ